MRLKVILAVLLAGAALAATIAAFRPHAPLANPEPQQSETNPSPELSALPLQPRKPEPEQTSRPLGPVPTEIALPGRPAGTNKLERLMQIRESFHALAAGDAAAALRAAKQITNEIERETALLTLVTEWTHGELRPSRERAQAIADYGIEAGLGIELAKNRELALLWANELTDERSRAPILREVAVNLVGSDPAAAFALSDQVAEPDRRTFFDALFAQWAYKDTDAALRWANQFPDPAEQEAAVAAIRSTAPVGIGASLSMKDGLTTINQLVAGAPAELSGQLRPGDRIVALAQGDNSFVTAQGVSLADMVKMIRGAPGSLLQLQILSADAAPNTPPRTVSIIRDQVKFKH